MKRNLDRYLFFTLFERDISLIIDLKFKRMILKKKVENHQISIELVFRSPLSNIQLLT